MLHAHKLTAVFLGSKSLLVQCAERFIDNGHVLRAIVSSDSTARRWADKHDVPFIEPGSDLVARLRDVAFDYLFSIVQLVVVPATVLALARKGAINFHDGPLPAYAGLNVTSWALLNQEPEHGISWHVMEAAVDRGDVLHEVRFPIDDHDTALTVNVKCFEAGLESFGTLLASLERGTLERRRQDPTRFKYYGRHDRPANAAIIDWSRSADDIAALVRALNFGPYVNPLSEAKVWLNGRPLIVKEATVLPVLSSMSPGTICAIADDGITVATPDLDIHLSNFLSMTGRPVEIRQILATHGLAERAILKPLAAEFGVAATHFHSALSRHEGFWVRRLANLEPIEIPYARRRSQEAEPRYHRAVLPMPQKVLRAWGNGADEALLTALTLYFARIGRKTPFDLMFQDVSLRKAVAGLEELFAAHVPLRVAIVPQQTFSQARLALAQELERLRERGTYALDLVPRQPDFKATARHWHDAPGPIVIQRLVSLDRSTHAPRADLTINIGPDGVESHWHYRTDVFDDLTIARMQGQFAALLTEAASSDRPVSELSILTDKESHELLTVRNRTALNYPRERCVHELLESQTQRTPSNAAVIFRDSVTTYAKLDTHANRIAHYLLQHCQVSPGALIGVLMDRSDEMIAGMIGIWKAGCAYVPLDPEYPRERLAYMARDAGLTAVLSQTRYADYLPEVAVNLVALDQVAEQLQRQRATKPAVPVQPADLAYVIYTSGSAGRPKGVMVEHRNVANFFAGMDERLDHDEPGTWLAVTSISFDISVLEIFWPLTHGFKVVLYPGADAPASATPRPSAPRTRSPALDRSGPALDFSLFYFSSDEGERDRNRYHLLLEGAKFADANDFVAVWTPERHFHPFGGLYPNPALTSAAIAAVTHKLQIRAGSCVLPLHCPIRVAEEWALVDNLSNGRVGISFASGWQPDDFAIAPCAYQERSRLLYEGIKTVRALWRGERIAFDGPKGKVLIQTLPRPVQPELPFWVTAAGNPETFRRAGEIGANLLTHLLGQSVEELGEKLKIFREARRDAGHEGAPCVTLMLHTFVAGDREYVRAQVEQPLKNYLRTATDLVKKCASSFPAFRKGKAVEATDIDAVFQALSDEDLNALLNHAFHRYYETGGLFGTPGSCLAMVQRLRELGVDEIACLIDFGCPSETVLANLPWLNELRRLAMREPGAPAADSSVPEDYSIPALMEHHRVTHFQCTPSLATMLAKNRRARERLRPLKDMMVGGEAFPPELATDLQGLVAGRVINMYGPTETTIWSSTHHLEGPATNGVPLGTPIANTQVYIVDEHLQLLPAEVPGELVIGGDGVARGYLNRPELTAERFVRNPFRGGEGRLYRTGDLARWRTDGALEFLGRIDNQVKVRGYRIELGEIEQVLGHHPAVRQAVVAATDDAPGEKRLVGYIVAEPGEKPSIHDLREFLQQRLPDFMVPGSFVMLAALPLTPNQKVDRRALPPPDRLRPELSEGFVAPRTRIERKVSEFWASALGLEGIGINDNFIALGGDSLLAVEIFLRIRKEFDVDFPLHVFFKVPTIAGLAAELESILANRAMSPAALEILE
jgi:natural product biosynthesis luciferase-like monooxygenase protein